MRKVVAEDRNSLLHWAATATDRPVPSCAALQDGQVVLLLVLRTLLLPSLSHSDGSLSPLASARFAREKVRVELLSKEERWGEVGTRVNGLCGKPLSDTTSPLPELRREDGSSVEEIMAWWHRCCHAIQLRAYQRPCCQLLLSLFLLEKVSMGIASRGGDTLQEQLQLVYRCSVALPVDPVVLDAVVTLHRRLPIEARVPSSLPLHTLEGSMTNTYHPRGRRLWHIAFRSRSLSFAAETRSATPQPSPTAATTHVGRSSSHTSCPPSPSVGLGAADLSERGKRLLAQLLGVTTGSSSGSHPPSTLLPTACPLDAESSCVSSISPPALSSERSEQEFPSAMMTSRQSGSHPSSAANHSSLLPLNAVCKHANTRGSGSESDDDSAGSRSIHMDPTHSSAPPTPRHTASMSTATTGEDTDRTTAAEGLDERQLRILQKYHIL